MQDLFGASMPYSAEGGDLHRLCEHGLDEGASDAAPLGDRVRALLARRRKRRRVWPPCRTVVQGSQAEASFAVHFVEDRLPPNVPGYHEFLAGLHKGTSLR